MPFEAQLPGAPADAPIPTARPVGAGSIISRTFSVWGKCFWRLAGFGLLLTVPLFAVALAGVFGSFLAAGRGGEPNAVLAAAVSVVVVAVAAVLGAAQLAGVTTVTLQTLADRPFRFGLLVSSGFARLLPVLGAGLLAGGLVAVGLALALVPGIVVACGFTAVIPLVTVERLGPVPAMRRSWALTRGHRWTLFFTAVVLVLASMGIAILGALLQIVPLLGLIASLGVHAAAVALLIVGPAVAYHDLRVQKEGAASDQLARVFE